MKNNGDTGSDFIIFFIIIGVGYTTLSNYSEYIRMYIIPLLFSVAFLILAYMKLIKKYEFTKWSLILLGIITPLFLSRPFVEEYDLMTWYLLSDPIGSMFDEYHTAVAGKILFWSALISHIAVYFENYISATARVRDLLLAKFERRRIPKLQNEPRSKPLYIGKSNSLTKGVRRKIGEKELMKSLENANTLILGMPGSGKTFGMITPMIYNSISKGEFTVIIQPKNNIEFRDRVYGACLKYNRESDFIFISTTDAHKSSGYNPLGFGTDQEKRDKIMASTIWANSHYEKLAEAKLLDVIKTKGVQRFSELDKLIPNTEDFTGLLADINNYNKSEIGLIFNRKGASNILDFYKEKKVLYIALDTNSAPVTSRIFGKILLNDIRALVNYIYNNIPLQQRKKASIYIDEFVSFITSGYIDLLNKIRETDMRVVMATQSPDDLYIDKENIRRQLFDNCKNIITFCLQDPDSCDVISKTFGTINEVKETIQVQKGLFNKVETGLGSARDVQSMVINGNDIRQLHSLECFIRTTMPELRHYMKCDWFKRLHVEQIPYGNTFNVTKDIEEVSNQSIDISTPTETKLTTVEIASVAGDKPKENPINTKIKRRNFKNVIASKRTNHLTGKSNKNEIGANSHHVQ